MKLDDRFGNLVEQLEQSQYPWTDDKKMAVKAREVFEAMKSGTRNTRSDNCTTTLKDMLVIWKRSQNTFFKGVNHIDEKKRDLNKQNISKRAKQNGRDGNHRIGCGGEHEFERFLS